MVAVDRADRALRHVSRPLRRQMRTLIDRGRWPVLVTYSDIGQGHTGHVYKCSGWQKTTIRKAGTLTDSAGARVSAYSGGTMRDTDGLKRGVTHIQRWEHWACERGRALEFMTDAGWRKTATGKTWDNGNPRHAWVKDEQLVLL